MIKVAYVKENIDCQMFEIHKGAVFLVKDKDTLEGFHNGITESIEKLRIFPRWEFDGKLLFYDVDEDCINCKYCHFGENGRYCTSIECVL